MCGCRSNLFAAVCDQASSAPPVSLQSYISLDSWGLSQGAGSVWLFHFFFMHLLCISVEASLCQSLSLRAFIPLLQVITFSSKLRPGPSGTELWKLVLSQPWRDSSSGCLCTSLTPSRQQLCTVISGTAWLPALPWSTSQAPERGTECKAIYKHQRGAELG